MNIRRIAVPVAAGTLTLLALGGTAVALGSTGTTPAPTPVAVTSTTTPTTTSASPVDDEVSVDRARELAVAEVGGGEITGIQQELEHGRLEWKIEVVRDGVRHDVRIDAGTGTVTRHDGATSARSTHSAPPSTRSASPTTTDDHGGDRDRRGDDDRGRGGDDDRGRHGGDDHDDEHDDDRGGNSGRG